MKSRLAAVALLGAALMVAGWAFAQEKSDVAAGDACTAETKCCASQEGCCAKKSEGCNAEAGCSAVAKKGDVQSVVLCPVSGVALKTCPVSGKPTNAVLASYQGAKVYLGCEACAAKFTKDKAKYAAKANLQLAATGQAKQIACPLSGKKVTKDGIVKVAGLKVAVCCGGCTKKLRTAEAKDQIELIFGKKGFAKGFALKKPTDKKQIAKAG